MGTESPSSALSLRLRNLPLPARLVISAFLLSVGLGYLAALVQLHMQHATKGNVLPTAEDAERIFAGKKGERPKSKIESLLETPVAEKDAEAAKQFSGNGQMCEAFTKKSTKPDWESALEERAGKIAKDPDDIQDAERERAEKELRLERDGERQAVVAWVSAGAKEEEYKRDRFVLPDELKDHPLTKKYVVKDGDQCLVKTTSILTDRCYRCHKTDGVGKAKDFPLNDYAKLKPYVQVSETSTRMSTEKLAQTTHVHLLGFSMLYGLTGLIFAFTSYPGIVRALIAPLPLVAQVIDISCWWLARVDPRFAHVIVYTGGAVAGGLMLHIGLTLFNLYGWKGKGLLLLLVVAAGLGGWQLKQNVIDPYLADEKPAAAPVAEK
jgi:hypothetical protein